MSTVIKQCVTCGGDFTRTIRERAIYCGSECRWIARRSHELIAKRLSAAKHRAKRSGLEFDLDGEDLRDIYTPFCAVTGVRFEFGDKDATGHHPTVPSLDRIDSTKGYTPGNVQWVTWEYNQFKRNKTDAEAKASILRMANAIRRTSP